MDNGVTNFALIFKLVEMSRVCVCVCVGGGGGRGGSKFQIFIWESPDIPDIFKLGKQ